MSGQGSVFLPTDGARREILRLAEDAADPLRDGLGKSKDRGKTDPKKSAGRTNSLANA